MKRIEHSANLPCRSHQQAGVTLVELSIVLVILALLTAGVMSGVALLRSAQMRQIFSDQQRYQTAMSNFVTTYGDLPGDLTDATSVWGMAPNAAAPAANDSACAALNRNSPSQGTRTCNGDGDGTISVGYEEFRAWQQLSNANLIEGNYTGVGNSITAGEGYQAEFNCPMSSFRDACWRVFYRDSSDAHRDPFRLFEGDYESHLFSLWGGVGSESFLTPVLTAAEMWELDNKMDDGKPASGSVVVPHGGGASNPFSDCTRFGAGAAGESNTDATYNTTGNERACQIYIKGNF